jgi:cytochrome o ubiquinol oxidase subunit III
MNISVASSSGAHGHAADHGHDDGSRTVFGFWTYLMSDCLIFASLFATFGVLAESYAGGPTGKDIFDLPYVGVETLLLLISSFTFGLASLSLQAGNKAKVVAWLIVTILFGLGFIGMEIHEFAHLVGDGAGPDRSAFLSAYFTLVGAHGLHVTVGLIWLAVMIDQIRRFGLDAVVRRRIACLSLFWHFLDLIWICVFTFVYLRGVL